MGSRRRTSPSGTRRSAKAPTSGSTRGLRIIGGCFRGRRLLYSGDPRVRPMKDRLREAVFNRIGPAVRDKHAVDLFAGTGALGLEAISRGAAKATLIERHLPTAQLMQKNVAALNVEEIAETVVADVFSWWQRRPALGPTPWLVFCSPPYDFYVHRTSEMLELLGGLIESAPAESIFAVESDEQFDFRLLPDQNAWDIRAYPPAVLGIYVRRVG